MVRFKQKVWIMVTIVHLDLRTAIEIAVCFQKVRVGVIPEYAVGQNNVN